MSRTFHPYACDNPHWASAMRAHPRGPYRLRYAGGRPQGTYATLDEAVSAAQDGASVVLADGAWIVGRVTVHG